jgi:hypothetical protein
LRLFFPQCDRPSFTTTQNIIVSSASFSQHLFPLLRNSNQQSFRIALKSIYIFVQQINILVTHSVSIPTSLAMHQNIKIYRRLH